MSKDLTVLVEMMRDENVPQVRRDDAAKRLVSRMGGPEGERVAALLQTTLVNVQNRGGQLAAARAMVLADHPDPAFIAPLNALLGVDRPLTEAASEALANFRDAPQVAGLLLKFLEEGAGSGGGTAVGGVGGGVGGGRSELLRVTVVRALAGVPDKRVAEALVAMLSDRGESELMREAAAESLSELAGRSYVGPDVGLWKAWWAESSKLTDSEFRQVAQANRSARMTRWRNQYERLSDEVSVALVEGYRQVAESAKADRLLQLLRSSEPAIRAAGVRIALGDVLEARAVPAAAREELRQMVGDSSVVVRLEVAGALRSLNDAAALEPLLTQLRQEKDPGVRAAIVAALGPIRDVRAVGALLGVLADEGRAAVAAAEALAPLGVEIRKQQALADEVADRLRGVLVGERVGGGEELRAAALEALIPLRRREVIPLAQSLLDPAGSARMRRAALRLLGELHDPDTAASIVASMEDVSSDASVRMEAVAALGAIPTFAHAEALYRRLDEKTEPDAAVRARAWSELSGLFAQANREQLADWSQRLKGDPARLLVVLSALAGKLQNPGDEEALAVFRQQQGETLLLLDRPAEAVRPLQDALAIWEGKGARNEYTHALQVKLLEAMIKGRQFSDAAGFASKVLGLPGVDEGQIGSMLVNEIKRLADQGEIPAATLLLSEVRKMERAVPAAFQPTLAELNARLVGPSTLPSTRGAVGPTTAATRAATTQSAGGNGNGTGSATKPAGGN